MKVAFQTSLRSVNPAFEELGFLVDAIVELTVIET